MGLRRFFRRATRKTENFLHRAAGQGNIGSQNGANSTAGTMTMQDVARSRAAGSGMVNYTDQQAVMH